MEITQELINKIAPAQYQDKGLSELPLLMRQRIQNIADDEEKYARVMGVQNEE